jgi:hypothetical protein
MKNVTRARLGAALTITPLLSLNAAATQTRPAGPSLATYEGRSIDLRQGWGTAQACISDGITTACYRTEAEMNASLTPPSTPAVAATAASSCNANLRLYANNSYLGQSLTLTTRGTWISLSTYGFSGITSSFQIGGCSATLADANTNYPGATGAGSQSASMAAGWDNRITRVRIS